MYLYEIWGNTEEILYKLCNENGSIPRKNIKKYARPISYNIKQCIENGTINLENEQDLNEFIENLQSIQFQRGSSLNLLSIPWRNTVEFRIPNGSINPDTWIENIRLFGRIIQIAEKLAEIKSQTEISENDQVLVNLMENLKNEEITEQERMEILLEMLFDENEKQVYRERYITCTKLLEQTSDLDNPLHNFSFKPIKSRNNNHSNVNSPNSVKNNEHNKREYLELARNSKASDIINISKDLEPHSTNCKEL